MPGLPGSCILLRTISPIAASTIAPTQAAPRSGHWNSVAQCPLCAKSGHRLFDQLVGTQLQFTRNREPDRLRSLEIDHQLVLGGRLNG